MSSGGQGRSPGCLVIIWGDAGDAGDAGIEFHQCVIDTYRWALEVVHRTEQVKGFVLVRQRWKVECTFGWFNWCRRLSKDYEILLETAEAFIDVASIRLILRCLA